MKVTLYQNCILTNAYSEVFDNRRPNPRTTTGNTALQDYLNGLPHFNIVVNDSYMPMSGNITFENDLIIQHIRLMNTPCNYMEVTDTDTGVHFYAFIDDFQVVNNLVMVEYSVDVWSTFSHLMNIRNSHLTNSYALEYNNRQIFNYNYPIKIYDSRGEKILPIRGIVDSYGCYVLVELQYYRVGKDNETPYRGSTLCLLSPYNGTPTTPTLIDDWNDIKYSNVMDAISSIQELILGSPLSASNELHYKDNKLSTNFLVWGASHTTNSYLSFDIGKIYLLPDYFDFSSIPQKYNDIKRVFYTSSTYSIASEGNTAWGVQGFVLYDIGGTALLNRKYLTTVHSDYMFDTLKISHIGTYTTKIPIISSGLTTKYTITLSFSSGQIGVYLNCQNNITEISNDFNYVPNVNPANGIEYVNRSIDYNLNLQKIQMQRAGIVSGFIGRIIPNKNTNYNPFALGSNTALNIGDLVTGLEQNNAIRDAYLSDRSNYSTSVSYDNIAILNCVGLVQYYYDIDIDSESTIDDELYTNKLQLQNAIKNIGYSVDETVNNEVFIVNDNIEFNILKFDRLNLYGGFAQNIAEILKQILYNGVKIYYTNNV